MMSSFVEDAGRGGEPVSDKVGDFLLQKLGDLEVIDSWLVVSTINFVWGNDG